MITKPLILGGCNAQRSISTGDISLVTALDEVRFWNRSLTGTEIQRSMNTKILQNNNLTGYWNFDDQRNRLYFISDLSHSNYSGQGQPGWSNDFLRYFVMSPDHKIIDHRCVTWTVCGYTGQISIDMGDAVPGSYLSIEIGYQSAGPVFHVAGKMAHPATFTLSEPKLFYSTTIWGDDMTDFSDRHTLETNHMAMNSPMTDLSGDSLVLITWAQSRYDNKVFAASGSDDPMTDFIRSQDIWFAVFDLKKESLVQTGQLMDDSLTALSGRAEGQHSTVRTSHVKGQGWSSPATLGGYGTYV